MIAIIGITHIRYCGLNTRLLATTISRQSVSARPNSIRPLSCSQYTARQPPTRPSSASRLTSPEIAPTRLYEWNEWSGATWRPNTPLSHSTEAGTDSTWRGRCALYTNGPSQPPGLSTAEIANTATTEP